MWLAFNEIGGQVEKQLDYGPKARQGVVGSFSIFANFGALEIDTSSTATITFQRPDGTHINVSYVMDYTEELFDINLCGSRVNTYPFVNGMRYRGFIFTPQDPAILSMAGQYHAAIRIFRPNKVEVQGEFVFNVENAVYNESHEISDTDYTQIMMRMFGKADNDTIGDAYSEDLIYDVGDIVIYDYSLYLCISPVATPGAFDPSKWQKTTLDSVIRSRITLAQLDPGITLDNEVTESSVNGVRSSGIYSAIHSLPDSFDAVPTEDSENGVKSGGVFDAINEKINNFDSAPTEDSDNGVTSGGVYSAIDGLKSDVEDGTVVAEQSAKAISTMFSLDENGDVAGFLHTTIPGANNRGMNSSGDNTTTSVNSGGDNPDRGPYIDEMHKDRNYLIIIQYQDYQGTECMASCGVMHMFPNQLTETPLFKIRGDHEGTHRWIKAQFTPPALLSEDTRVKCSVWVGNFNGASAYVESRPYLNDENIIQYLPGHLPQIYFREIK